MNCLFPLEKLLDKNSNVTLQDIDEAKLSSDKDIRLSENLVVRVKSDQKLDTRRKMSKNQSIKLEGAQCLISIFDEAIEQIHIISGGKKSQNALDEFTKSLENRLEKVYLYDPIFDKVTGDPYIVYFTKQKLGKILTDCSKVNEFLFLIRNELKEENALKTIRTISKNIMQNKMEEQQLLIDEHRNFKKLKHFKEHLLNQNREIQKFLDGIRDELYEERDKTETLVFENLLREKYVRHWEGARREQNNLWCKRAEDELKATIMKYNNEINTESRVYDEEVDFLLEEKQDFQYNIKYWTDKLAEESDQRTIQNQIIKERREDIQKQYEELDVLYKAREKEINGYIRVKEKRAREWEEKERRRKAATKIQAWWRGIMVRLKLGPYNPKRRRKKGKKGKKGKKKK